ncbi:MAG: S41 family peptidase [Planctomycetota bacterium]|nr:S41 family peptidase [Planctomycetota bacterium]
MLRTIVSALLAALVFSTTGQAHVGYYRYPALHEDTLVFAAEGDLWVVSVEGGAARRLTTHGEEETHPAISPDGSLVAFCAGYEGPTEIYTIPLEGGVPVRRTYGTRRAAVAGWTPEGEILYTSRHHATLPNSQLFAINLETNEQTRLPLAQASDGVINEDGVLFFTRLPFQGSHVKRYVGGTARNLWKFSDELKEAVPLIPGSRNESFNPMWWSGRLYFTTDRDGTMNIWSMEPNGSDLKQHTHYKGWGVKTPSLSEGRIVYQLGAELHLFDIRNPPAKTIPITLASDLAQMGVKWLTRPMSYLTSAHPSPDGDRVVLTARGEIFVAPRKEGRLIQLTRTSGVRYRQATFDPEGESIITFSDESGEIELWSIPADGLGAPEQLTEGGTILRFDPTVSPDGRWIAYQDKNWELWVYDTEEGRHTRIARSDWEQFRDLTWSPDSKWLAFVEVAANTFRQIRLYHVTDGSIVTVTSDRINSSSPAWTPDGKWMYFLSDRNFSNLTGSVWGPYQPEPVLHDMTELYVVSLTEEKRSPFQPPDELVAAEEKEKEEAEEDEAEEAADEDADETDEADNEDETDDADEDDEDEISELDLFLDDIRHRAMRVPVPPGEYSSLSVTDRHLYWIAREGPPSRKRSLQALKIGNEKPEVKTVADDVRSYELTLDRKRILLRKGSSFHIIDAKGGKAALDDAKVDLSRWRFPLDPREEWRQMFTEAWRLERDYFYAPNMHGVDWRAMLEKYRPLVDRVTTRAELSDLLAQMMSEISALHTFVVGGDYRSGRQSIGQAALGARLARDEQAGGYRIEHIYRTDPDFPDRRSPLARPHLEIDEDDVIEMVNGVDTLSVRDIGILLRDQAGVQVRLRLIPADGGEKRDVIVEPISFPAERSLRYDDWEHTRRLMVEELSDGRIGYVHLRAMGGGNYSEFARNFYPVFDREGLIIDVRHNNGGNIDSWILSRLIREAWMYWKGRVGEPTWNMQYAFRGHMAALCNERTASDGETFIEGFRRLGLGKVIGTRTWGGGIWLSMSNRLVDFGIASAAEFGVYGPEGEWIIEMDGVEPDMVVDNLPHATFKGEDAQLRAAVEHLLERIAADPRPVPPPPPWPDKSFDNN